MFHMVTHAFFKACLFLSAGSVIHGCHHVQDMRVMGGLRKKMPITFACTLICTLAISGVPFFSGFYSKDMIILAGWARVLDEPFFDGWGLYALLALALAAALTAFYMFRLIFMTFFGEYRGNQEIHAYSAQLAAEGYEGPPPHGHDAGHDGHGDGYAHDSQGHAGHGHAHHEPHESPRGMVFALGILAFFGLLGGHFWLLDPGHLFHFWHSTPWFTQLASLETLYGDAAQFVSLRVSEGISDHNSEIAHLAHGRAVLLSLFVAGTGIFLAFLLYVVRKDVPSKVTAKLGLAYVCIRNRYFIDEAAEAVAIRPSLRLASFLKAFDEKVIDGLVLLVGRTNRALGFFWAWFDKTFVDGAVNGVGLISQSFGSILRLLQTGRIQQYAAFAVAGGLLAAAWLVLS